jgi:hypothetical protein
VLTPVCVDGTGSAATTGLNVAAENNQQQGNGGYFKAFERDHDISINIEQMEIL